METPMDQPPSRGPATPAAGVRAAGWSVRPTHITVSAVMLIAFGAFVSLVGLALVVIGLLGRDPANPPAGADPPTAQVSWVAAVAVGSGLLAYGIAQVVTGVGALGGRNWARPAGVGVAGIGALITVGGLFAPVGGPSAGATTILLPFLGAYLYTAWAVAAHPQWFSDR